MTATPDKPWDVARVSADLPPFLVDAIAVMTFLLLCCLHRPAQHAAIHLGERAGTGGPAREKRGEGQNRTMQGKIEEKIERLLGEGKGRKVILKTLQDHEEPGKLLFHLNNISRPRDRGRYQVHNLVLVLILAFVTAKKLLAVFSFGALDLVLLISLVAPVINLYLLREILRFRRVGYQFLCVLSLLALLLPENHFLPEALLQIFMAGLAGFLYLRLFPAREMVREVRG